MATTKHSFASKRSSNNNERPSRYSYNTKRLSKRVISDNFSKYGFQSKHEIPPAPANKTVKPKTKRGFGGFQERFSKYGFHPRLDKSGSMKVDKVNLGPGQYDVPKIGCCHYKDNQAMSTWTRALDSEEFARHLGFRNATILAAREFRKKHLGPGSQDLNEALFKQTDVSPCNDQNFGKQRKFFGWTENNPPPGTYDVLKVDHDFSTQYPRINKAKRFQEEDRAWYMAPNRYDAQDPKSLDALLNKVISKRGPYDLFTGPRSYENIFNKFFAPKICTPDKFYTYQTHLDYLLHHESQLRTGKFLKGVRSPDKPTVRMLLMDQATCYHDPEWPGPANYNLDGHKIRKVTEAMYGFGITGRHARPDLEWRISPGPGRYHIKYSIKCVPSKMGTSVFKSKTQRTKYKAPEYNAF